MVQLALIIPAYNEEKRIGRTLSAYYNFLKGKKSKQFNFEVIVVLNKCTDNTKAVVEKNSFPEMRLIELPRKGKGLAVIEGFKDALTRRNDIIGFVDADMATAPEEYWKLVQQLNGYGGTIADRYLPESRITPAPTLPRLFAKRLFNFLVRCVLLLPFGDTQCGAKIFRRKTLIDIVPHLSMSQWAFDVELLYMAHKYGHSIKSVPTLWSDKAYSTINFWKAGPSMAFGVVRLRIVHSPFRAIVRVYDFIIRTIKRNE